MNSLQRVKHITVNLFLLMNPVKHKGRIVPINPPLSQHLSYFFLAFTPVKCVCCKQLRIILKHFHLRIHFFNPPLMRLAPLPHRLLNHAVFSLNPLINPVQLPVLYSLLSIVECCLDMLILFDLLGESILRLKLSDLLPPGRIDSILGLHEVLPYIDLLLELFIHVIASLLVTLIRRFQLLFTHAGLICSSLPFLLSLSKLVLFKSNLIHLHLLILFFKHLLPLRLLYEVLHAHLHLVFDLHQP